MGSFFSSDVMAQYRRRFSGFILLSMGLALAAGPFPGTQTIRKTVNALFLSAVVLGEAPPLPPCSEKPRVLSPKDLKGYPMIQKALSSPAFRKMEHTVTRLYDAGIDGFMKRFGGEGATSLCFTFEEKTFVLVPMLYRDLGTLHLVGLKNPPSGTTVLPPSELKRFPALESYLNSLDEMAETAEKANRSGRRASERSISENPPDFASGDMAMKNVRAMFEKIQRSGRRTVNLMESRRWLDYCDEKRIHMPPAQWDALHSALGTDTVNVRFIVEDYMLLAHQKPDTETVETAFRWFAPLRYFLAAGLLVLGVIAMRNVYGKRPGIRLNPVRFSVAGDAMIILFLAFGAFCLVDFFLIRFFHMNSVFPDDIVRGMCAIAYVPVSLFFAVFAANLGQQSIGIDGRGLYLHYPGRSHALPWDVITGFRLRETSVLVGRAGFLMPRKLQTKLVVQTEEEDMELVEPGLRRTKTRLVRDLLNEAPERLQNDLHRIAEEW